MNEENDLLLGMLFKIAFLKSMLPVMVLSDVERYIEVVKRMISGDLLQEDVRFINELYKKFESEAVPNVTN